MKNAKAAISGHRVGGRGGGGVKSLRTGCEVGWKNKINDRTRKLAIYQLGGTTDRKLLSCLVDFGH